MDSLSIHPRNWPRGNGEVKDTSKPHKGGGKLGKKREKLNKRRLEHSSTLKRLPSTANPMAYKSPGSMNEHK